MKKQYDTAKLNYELLSQQETKLLTFSTVLKEMKMFGIKYEEVLNEVEFLYEITKNQKIANKEVMDKSKINICEFSFLILVTNDKKIFLSKRNNPTKDYYGKYQVTGGHKETDESFEQCAIREAKEEAELDIEEIEFICLHEGFRVFPDEQECMYRYVIYYSIIDDQVPKRTEPNNNDEWILVEIKDLHRYELTNSLQIKLSLIIEVISNKFRSIINKKKRKVVENKGNLENGVSTPESSLSDKKE